MRIMSALPVDPTPREDPLDPESILRALPERERETFRAEYRRAVDDARDPARWPELRRFLRLWTWRTVAVAEPGVLRALGAGERGHGRRDAPGGRDQALPPRPVSYRSLLGKQVLRQMRGLMNYALSRTSAGGGPRTASAASTGHRQAAKSYSSGSSRLSQPSRSLADRCRAAWY